MKSRELTIKLFGAFEAEIGGQPLETPGLRKIKILLAWLVVNRENFADYPEIVRALWPNSVSADNGRDSVRAHVAELRKWLGPESHRLEKDGKSAVRLNLQFAAVDIVQFDRLIAMGDAESLRKAVELYRGPFLDGSADPWAVDLREKYAESYKRAVEALSRTPALVASGRGQAPEASVREPAARSLNGHGPLIALPVSSPRHRLTKPVIASIAGIICIAGFAAYILRANSPTSEIITLPPLPAPIKPLELSELNALLGDFKSTFAEGQPPNAETTAQLADVYAGGAVRIASVLENAVSASYSPDGSKAVIVREDGTVHLHDASTWKHLFKYDSAGLHIKRARFDDWGKAVTATDGRKVSVWVTETGKLHKHVPDRGFPVIAVRFNGFETRVAYQKPDRVMLWNSLTNADTQLDGQSGIADAADFLKDGGGMAVANDRHEISIYGTNPAEGKTSVQPMGTFRGHKARVTSLETSENGGCSASEDGYVAVWSDNGGTTLSERHVAPGKGVFAVRSPDESSVIVACGDNSIQFYSSNLSARAMLSVSQKPTPRSISLAPDNRNLLVVEADGSVALVRIPSRIYSAHYDGVNVAAIGKDGKIATGSKGGGVFIWNAKLRTWVGQVGGFKGAGHEHHKQVYHCALSPDGYRLISAGEAKTTLILWDLHDMWRGPKEVRVGKDRQQLLQGHAGAVNYVEFNRDGTLFSTAGEDGTARIWNLKSGKMILLKHGGNVRAAMFHPRDKRVLTPGYDGRLLLWAYPYNEPRLIRTFDSGIYSAGGRLMAGRLSSRE